MVETRNPSGPGEVEAGIATEIESVRAKLADDLRRTAERANIDVDPSYLAVVSNGEFAAAFTLVPSHPCNLFGYLAVPKQSRLNLPRDFYLFDAVGLEPEAWQGTAVLRTMDGNVALDNVEVTVERSERGPGRPGLSLDLSAIAFSAKRWKPQGSPGSHIVDIFTIRF